MCALGVVESQTVQQNQCLSESGAANREISLHCVGAALAEIDRGVGVKVVGPVVVEERVFARIDDCDGAVNVIDGNRSKSPGDDDDLFALLDFFFF